MGPKVLSIEEISRYIDGELSEAERRDIEFQLESFAKSREKLEEHRTVARDISNLLDEVILNDPAYHAFIQMVQDFEPRPIDLDIQAIRELIPDRDRLRRILDQLSSELYGTLSEASMSMVSPEKSSSMSLEMDRLLIEDRSRDPARIGNELGRHIEEFSGVHALFSKAFPEFNAELEKLQSIAMALRKIERSEADPEIAVITVLIERLVERGLPGARIMLKIVVGDSIFKRDYQKAIREIAKFIESTQ